MGSTTWSRQGELSPIFGSAWVLGFSLRPGRAFVSVLVLSLSLGLFLLTIFSFGLGWLSFVFSQLVVFRLHLLPVALVITAFACYGAGFHFSFVWICVLA
jgi:hypothetical protein